MNLPIQKRIHIPIVLDSDSYDDYSYDESYYDSYSSENISNSNKKTEVKEVVKLQPKAPFVPRPPLNGMRSLSPARKRPILKPPPNLNNQRPNSAPLEKCSNEKEHDVPHINHQAQKEEAIRPETRSDSSCFEIEHPEFVELHTYALVEKKNATVFKKTRTYSLLEKGEVIRQSTLKSLSRGKIKLTKDVILFIRNNRTEFVLKTNEKKPKSLCHITFLPPYSFEQCQRRASIHFGHNTGGMLPPKIVSLPAINETVFNGHFYVESKRNVAFAIVNNSRPVLTVRQIKSDIIEIDTVLNLSESLVFGLAIALYIGKNVIPENEEAMNDKEKFQLLKFSRFLNQS